MPLLKNVNPTLHNSPKKLKQYIECPVSYWASRTPDAIAIWDEQPISYIELDKAITNYKITTSNINAATNTETIIALFAFQRSQKPVFLINPKSPLVYEEIFPEIHSLPQSKELRTNTPAVVIQTSGTSGSPKKAVLSIGNFYESAKASNIKIPVLPEDIWLLDMPLYHVSGLSILWRCFLSGASISLTIKSEITHRSMSLTHLIRFLKKPIKMPNLKIVLCGGSHFPNEIIKKATSLNLPIYQSYGLTEMCSQVFTKGLLDHAQLKIKNKNELHVKGSSLFLGYLQPDHTISLNLDSDGWFKTGDSGELISETRLEDIKRLDRLFISGGENIQPEEIEKILLQHTSIKTAKVLPQKDIEFGQRPICYISFHSHKITKKDLNSFLSEKLPKFKWPINYYTEK